MEAPPDFIKPNRYELLRYFGVEDKGERTDGYLLGLLRKLLGRGVKLAALSLGGAGALFACGEYAWRGDALSVPIRSTVGAGDSMTGALAYGIDKGLPLKKCLALSLAASAGAVTTAGTKAPEAPVVKALLKLVTLHPVR
jgi:1-phosphofructokinase